jgi:hypothetical protein
VESPRASEKRHLIWFSSFGKQFFSAICYLDSEAVSIETEFTGRSILVGDWGSTYRLYLLLAARLPCWRSVDGLSSRPRGGTLAVILWCDSVSERAPVVGGDDGSIAHFLWHSAVVEPNHSRAEWNSFSWACLGRTNRFDHRRLYPYRRLFSEGANAFPRFGGVLREPVSDSRACARPSQGEAGYPLCWRESLGISVLTAYRLCLGVVRNEICPRQPHRPCARNVDDRPGAFVGAKLLREDYGIPRLIGTTLIASGVLMLTLG